MATTAAKSRYAIFFSTTVDSSTTTQIFRVKDAADLGTESVCGPTSFRSWLRWRCDTRHYGFPEPNEQRFSYANTNFVLAGMIIERANWPQLGAGGSRSNCAQASPREHDRAGNLGCHA